MLTSRLPTTAIMTAPAILPVVERPRARPFLSVLTWFALTPLRPFRRLAILIVAIGTILAFRLTAIVAVVGLLAMAAILLVSLGVTIALAAIALAAILGLGLRPISGILLRPAILLVAALRLARVGLPSLLTIVVAAWRLAFALLFGSELFAAAFAGSLFAALAAAVILAVIAFRAIAAVGIAPALLLLLLLSRRDNAVIVLRMLQIAFGNDPIARGRGITRKL